MMTSEFTVLPDFVRDILEGRDPEIRNVHLVNPR